jgi:glutamate transport system substrate-binding protein
MAELNEAGSIRVGTKYDQPGFGLENLEGELEGFDVEVAKIIAAELGIAPEDIEWQETPSAVREEVLEGDEVDLVVATYTINDERAERITFAGPYYEAGQQLMVKSDDTKITGPETLKANPDAKVCSVAGSTPAENILQYLASPNQLVTFDVYSKCADALRTKQVAAVTTDNVILLGLIDQSGGQFKLVDQKFTEEPYGIGVKKGDVAFCEFINQTLKEAEADGSYQAAWESTAGKVAPEAPTLPPADACS